MSPSHEPTRLLLGLVGAGLGRSRTPAMHEQEAAHHDVRCLYQRLDLDTLHLSVDALPQIIDAAERVGFAGLNVTHPCKQAVLPLLTHVSDDARRIQAVNTVVLRNGERVGHNTDWSAFRDAFASGLPGANLNSVVQLGAGGAGAATAYAALDLGVGRLSIADVAPGRAETLAARLDRLYPGRVRAVADVRNALRDADGLVHATPTGMASHSGLPLDAGLLRPDLWVADVVYFPVETELLRAARVLGCRTLDGCGMAVLQAVEAFRLFTGLAADAARMRATFERLG